MRSWANLFSSNFEYLLPVSFYVRKIFGYSYDQSKYCHKDCDESNRWAADRKTLHDVRHHHHLCMCLQWDEQTNLHIDSNKWGYWYPIYGGIHLHLNERPSADLVAWYTPKLRRKPRTWEMQIQWSNRKDN